ncbi:broad-complex core protein isoform X5 [Trichogramma pretiosum]|uniref:broad-complex core protein isoform X5 n=1 Tax=Trichogramma pretiosum TaxID=7493 RepID=UPI0006C9AEE0|nr:broad-complex core protein isoform X5 [Trichogramma pretiosum]
MVDTQHFCLRWNNYQSSITSAFENLRDDEDFVDVTLACDGKSLKAHRVVLSACSPYFRELLKSTPCKHPVIVLQDVAFSDLHALVEFIYHGEVNVHQRSLSSFLKTAEVLRVSGLTQQGDQADRDELSHVRALAAGAASLNATNHLGGNGGLHDKLVPEDNTYTRERNSPPTPVQQQPTPSPVQQLMRRAGVRGRNDRHTPDSHDTSGPGQLGADTKRPRVLSPPLNNNDAIPTDFSMVKNSLAHLVNAKIEGNGLHNNGEDNNGPIDDGVKCEPLELVGNSQSGHHQREQSSNNGPLNAHNEESSDSGATPDRPPASASSNEHDNEPPEHPPTPNYMAESKLFASTPGGFNFSMAALSQEHSPLSVKFPGLGHGLQTPDLAGTSQVLASMPGLTLNSLNTPSAKKLFTCQLCGKVLCSKASLKRHVADKHAERQEEYRCVICERVYCSRNSLMTHIYTYHKSRPGDIDIKFF